MKTTIYDLLGMIKDGNLVLEIVYKDVHYTWNYLDKTFYSLDGEKVDLFEDYVLTTILNDEVIILATAMNSNLDGLCQYKPYTGETVVVKPLPYEPYISPKDDKIEKINNSYYHLPQDEQNQLFKNKINEIIDYIQKE